MKPFELGQLLHELTAADQPRRKNLWHTAVRAVAEPWFDATWYARMEQAALQYQLPFQAGQLAGLQVGETWVLLYASNRAHGLTGRLQFGPDHYPDDHCDCSSIDAARNAHIALVGLAASKLRRMPRNVSAERFALTLPEAAGVVEGRSLGLACAIAMLSAALKRRARSEVAATACLHEDGTLAPVGHLREKLVDLAARRPAVTCVLVAVGQEGVQDAPPHIELRECASLAAAIEAAGLDIDLLDHADFEEFETRLNSLAKAEAMKSHSADGWHRVAVEAFGVGRALQKDTPDNAAKAFGLAALFALHAGSLDLANSFQKEATRIDAPPAPAVAAWLAIVAASGAIDQATVQLSPAMFDDAIHKAEQALAETQALPEGGQSNLRGQALGTLGRAYLHAGKPARGLACMREGVSHHQQHDAKEAPRTMTYLATCLRHAGQTESAAATARAALAQLEAMPRRALSATTRLYAQLELGRCALLLGDPWLALRAFQAVVDGQDSDAEHPRIAGLRGIASAQRALGVSSEAAVYRDRCIHVAMATERALYRLLGLMAVGDALIAGERCAEAVQCLWTMVTGAYTVDDTRRVLAAWVY